MINDKKESACLLHFWGGEGGGFKNVNWPPYQQKKKKKKETTVSTAHVQWKDPRIHQSISIVVLTISIDREREIGISTYRYIYSLEERKELPFFYLSLPLLVPQRTPFPPRPLSLSSPLPYSKKKKSRHVSRSSTITPQHTYIIETVWKREKERKAAGYGYIHTPTGTWKDRESYRCTKI